MLDKKIKVIAVVSPKGGAGKTTTTANLSAAFSNRGISVLALDTNITTPALGLHFGITKPSITFKEVLDKNLPVSRAINFYNEYLHVIPSAMSIELKYRPLPLQEKIAKLANHYDLLLTDLVKRYDLILLDSAPGFNAESISAMLTSDALIMVTNPELPAVIAAAKGVDYARLLKRKVLGIVLNKVRNRSYELSREEIEKAIGVKVIAEIPYDNNIPESIAHKIPVIESKRLSTASISYRELCADLLGEVYVYNLMEWLIKKL